MILCLDVGNSQIYAGLFQNDKLIFTFRKTSKGGSSSDEVGVFLRTTLRENGYNPQEVAQIGICSVVPDAIHSLRGACQKYFDIEPFIFQAGIKTGLKIKYRSPLEVGSDRIANAVAAVQLFPGRDLIIVDFGTATTFCAVTADKDYLGGIITAGIRISMEALESKTARLPVVEIAKPKTVVGRSTVESIQSGLYYGNVAMVRELVRQITDECFPDGDPIVIGTGGFSRFLEDSEVFDEVIPDLVLSGLITAIKMNA